MWMGDAKEAYYRTVASWQLLDGLHTRGQPPAEEVLQFLQTARSASKQAASELSGLAVREPASQATAVGWRRMHDDWLLAFERCAEEIAACAQPFRAPLEVRLPTRPVVEVSPTHFELPCALCGKTAVSFSTGVDRWSSKMALLFSGITHDRALNLALAAAAFEWLRREEIGKLHAHLIDSGTSHEGIDGYCPECDRVYCRQHYGAVEEFDEGFYDCTYGTCPAGHRRMIDD
jgi:hypothetical protein